MLLNYWPTRKLCWTNTLKHKITGEISGSKQQNNYCEHTTQREDLKGNMQKNKWHNISIKTESFEKLEEIQKRIPVRQSIPQVIEWLINIGQIQIIKGTINDNTSRIHRK